MCCSANSKDTQFASANNLQDSQRMMCAHCYWVWWPARAPFSWPDFVDKVKGDADLRSKVMAAKEKGIMPESESRAQCVMPESACATGQFAVKLSRSGRFLRKSDFKQLVDKKATPKQCRLRDPVGLNLMQGGNKVSGYLLSDTAQPLGFHCEVYTILSVECAEMALPLGQAHIEAIAEMALRSMMDKADNGLEHKQLRDFFMGKATSMQEVRERADRQAGAKKPSKCVGPADKKKRSKGEDDGDSSSDSEREGDDDEHGSGSQRLSDLDEEEVEGEELPGAAQSEQTPMKDPLRRKTAGVGLRNGPDASPGAHIAASPTATAKSPNSAGVAQELRWYGPNQVQYRMMSPAAKKALKSQDAAFSDDGRSMAGASTVAGGKRCKNKTPAQWVNKLPAELAMAENIDNRNILQAQKCIDRESKLGQDQAGAKRLRAHLALIAHCQNLLPAAVGPLSSEEPDIALSKVFDDGLPVPAETCFAILERHIATRSALLATTFTKDAASKFFQCLKLFFGPGDERTFKYSAPTLTPLMVVLALRMILKKWAQWIFTGLLVPMVEELEADSHLARLSDLAHEGLRSLDLPEDADPDEETLEAIVDAQSVFRAICLILNPKIGVDPAVHDRRRQAVVRARRGHEERPLLHHGRHGGEGQGDHREEFAGHLEVGEGLEVAWPGDPVAYEEVRGVGQYI